jgi:hypothetical protein
MKKMERTRTSVANLWEFRGGRKKEEENKTATTAAAAREREEQQSNCKAQTASSSDHWSYEEESVEYTE